MDIVSLLYGRQDRDWQTRANCMGVDPDLFFPERGASTREAKEVCRGCVVREDCLEYALANGEKFGIWGGLSERERRRLRRARAMSRRVSETASASSRPLGIPFVSRAGSPGVPRRPVGSRSICPHRPGAPLRQRPPVPADQFGPDDTRPRRHGPTVDLVVHHGRSHRHRIDEIA